MATDLTSSQIKEGFQENVPDQESVRLKDIEEDRIESHVAGRIVYGPWMPSPTFVRQVLAEFIGTFFLIFLGCGSVIIDQKSDRSITHLGVSLVWGMAVMIIIYAIGHISGAHLNPVVTLASALVRRFPWAQVPAYIGAQIFASISAGFVLRLMFGDVAHIAATVPTGSDMQSFVLEILITFFLMFVVSAVSTDTKAIGELAGLAVGTTIAMNVIIAGPISGASMNPARTIGSAVAGNKYTNIWVYMVAPPVGAVMGAMAYNMIRLTDKPLREISQSGSFLKGQRSGK